MTPEKWLSAKIKESGLKIYFVAQKAGMDPKHLSAVINFHRKVKAEEFVVLCSVIGVNAMDYVPIYYGGKENA